MFTKMIHCIDTFLCYVVQKFKNCTCVFTESIYTLIYIHLRETDLRILCFNIIHPRDKFGKSNLFTDSFSNMI